MIERKGYWNPIMQANFLPPTAIVIFGVTGDLTSRKLIPALYQLRLDDRLPNPFYVIGYARRDWDDETMREHLRKGVLEYARNQPVNEDVLNQTLGSFHYLKANFVEEDGYQRLEILLNQLGVANRLYYLASPPDVYSKIIQKLGSAGLGKNNEGWTRIVVEKPFGQDLDSARLLDGELHQVFSESQVYRIDHRSEE